jgi:hypothetical protein
MNFSFEILHGDRFIELTAFSLDQTRCVVDA